MSVHTQDHVCSVGGIVLLGCSIYGSLQSPLKITFDLATMSILSCQQKTSNSIYMLTHHQQVVAFMNIIDQRILKREIKHFRLTVKEDER